jgi:hypothetical protein
MYKYFFYALEGKHLVNKVRLRISSDCNAADYERWTDKFSLGHSFNVQY